MVFTRAYRPGFGQDHERFTQAGYVYVGQSTRGHAQSEGTDGVDNRFFDDAQDGYDALTWIAEQPFCDGHIAMYGKSYWGMTQWLVAPEQHPNLVAIVPQNMNPDPWERGYCDHGALQLAHTARRIYDGGGQDKVVQRHEGLLSPVESTHHYCTLSITPEGTAILFYAMHPDRRRPVGARFPVQVAGSPHPVYKFDPRRIQPDYRWPHEIVYCRSEDGGRNWSTPQPIKGRGCVGVGDQLLAFCRFLFLDQPGTAVASLVESDPLSAGSGPVAQ